MPETTETQELYTDIDYESFSIADLYLVMHWTDLPRSVLAARRKARQEARAAELFAKLPKNHKIILVPPHPTYSPFEEELWPILNEIVQNCLAPHPAIRATINRAITLAVRNKHFEALASRPEPRFLTDLSQLKWQFPGIRPDS